MKTQIQYLGLDVDDQRFHGCVIDSNSGEIMEFDCKPNVASLNKRLEKLKSSEAEMRICYEAGYLGYSLCRQLKSLGYECEVIAPSLIPEVKGRPVKTDRLDAHRLANYFMKGLLTTIHIPDERQEAVRDLIRSRKFIREELAQVRAHIISLCRRLNIQYQKEKNSKPRYWTGFHEEWLQKKCKEIPIEFHRVNLQHLLLTVSQLSQTLQAYEDEIGKLAEDSAYIKGVRSLRCFRGIDTLSAMTILSEVDDIYRFVHPEKLTSYTGMDLREYSSGGKEKKFGITRLGNRQLRCIVVEAVQSAANPPAICRKLKQRREGAPAQAIEIADRAMKRLYKKSRHLIERGKHPNQVKIAGAREMLSFIWEALRAAA